MTEINQETVRQLVIDENNFQEYFFDVRLHGPKKGQVIASYTAVAELCDGPEKRQIIEFLRLPNKIDAALQIMRKVLMAREVDSLKVLRKMGEDLLKRSVEEVAQNPYKFVFEAFYWTNPEYIPMDDLHWACVSVLNLEEHFAKNDAIEQGDIQIKAHLLKNDETTSSV